MLSNLFIELGSPGIEFKETPSCELYVQFIYQKKASPPGWLGKNTGLFARCTRGVPLGVLYLTKMAGSNSDFQSIKIDFPFNTESTSVRDE